MHADLSGKYVQFASELGKPQEPVNYLWYTEWADGQYRLQATERAAQSLGVNLRSRGIGDISEANDVMAAMKADGANRRAFIALIGGWLSLGRSRPARSRRRCGASA